MSLPRSSLVESAAAHVSAHLAEPVLHHSVRVAELATRISESEQLRIDPDLLWIASLFHDFGTVAGAEAPERFEVVGAQEAVRFLRTHGVQDEAAQEVWDAIALHTSPHIAEARGGLTRAIRLGVLMDFGDDVLADSAAIRAELERTAPRLDIEVVLADAVVGQAVACPEKAPPSSWPGDLYSWHLEHPEHRGRNAAF